MSKGYWVVHVDVHDNETYAKYREANAIAFEKFGARFIVRGGEQIIEEGHSEPRTVVVEFDDFEKAKKCYESEEYQKDGSWIGVLEMSAASFVKLEDALGSLTKGTAETKML